VSAWLLAALLLAQGEDPAARWRKQLRFHPTDAFAEYALITTMRRSGKSEAEIQAALPEVLRDRIGISASPTTLYSLTTGAVALQEGLQFDRLLGRPLPAESRKPSVPLSELRPPQLREHPFPEPKPEERPAVEALARLAPRDFWYARFRSVDALARFLEEAERFTGHFLKVYQASARDAGTRARLEETLALRLDETLRPLYGVAVREMAVLGSDPFLREGSDVTLAFHLRGEKFLFGAKLEASWERARASHPGAREVQEGSMRGLVTPDRAVSSWVAYSDEFAFVSNSRAALERIFKAAEGLAPALADLPEFLYMRKLFPVDADEEEGFVYLSDPFLRRVVGPGLRVAETRRVRCVASLRMISHARLLHRIDTGKDAGLDALTSAGYLREADVWCPSEGVYADKPACSVHGTLPRLTPCLETPVGDVTPVEAREYRAFAAEYDRLWRRYYDPIGIRLATRGGGLRLEMHVLPLADQSLYRALRRTAGGAAVDLPMPRPPGAVFGLALKVGDLPSWLPEKLVAVLRRDHGIDARAAVTSAFRSTMGLILFDAQLLFDYDLAGFFGEAATWDEGRDLSLLPLLAAANLPAGLVVPVADPEAAARLVRDVERALAAEGTRVGGARFSLRFEGYALEGEEGVRIAAVDWFAFRVRLWYALERDRLLIATRPETLRALRAAPLDSVRGNVAARMEPGRWERIRPDMELSYEEGARRACTGNLASVGALRRALQRVEEREARLLFGEWFACPDGGSYEAGDGEAGVVCGVHGSRRAPRQGAAPRGGFGEALRKLQAVESVLSFTEDGLFVRFALR